MAAANSGGTRSDLGVGCGWPVAIRPLRGNRKIVVENELV